MEKSGNSVLSGEWKDLPKLDMKQLIENLKVCFYVSLETCDDDFDLDCHLEKLFTKRCLFICIRELAITLLELIAKFITFAQIALRLRIS